MAEHRNWKSRATDYAWYVSIALALVGFILLVAIRAPNSEVGAQLVTAFLGACVMSAYIIPKFWKTRVHSVLLLYCAAVVCMHFALWMLAYRFTGRTNVYLAGSGLIVETAVLATVAEKIIPAKRAVAGRRH